MEPKKAINHLFLSKKDFVVKLCASNFLYKCLLGCNYGISKVPYCFISSSYNKRISSLTILLNVFAQQRIRVLPNAAFRYALSEPTVFRNVSANERSKLKKKQKYKYKYTNATVDLPIVLL